jgi:hypothetical protein
VGRFEVPIWHLKHWIGWKTISALCFHGTRSSHVINSPQNLEREAGLKAQLAAETSALDLANKEALAAARALAKAEAELARIREQQAKLGEVEIQLREIKGAKELEAARAADIAAGRGPVAPVAAAPAPGIATVTMGGATVPIAAGPEASARNRARALGSVAAGEAAAVAGNTGSSVGEQIAANQLLEAATALQGNGNLDTLNKVIDLLITLGKGQSDIVQRLRDAESQIKTARTR